MKDIVGLVTIGGLSTRMKSDKGFLVYDKEPQYKQTALLLKPFCRKVFISCNSLQEGYIDEYVNIPDMDSYKNIGPMAALLSAYTKHPGYNYLLTGCDYPLLKEKDIVEFISEIEMDQVSAFFNTKTSLYEPLLAYYPSHCYIKLREMQREGNYSLQNFLWEIPATRFIPTGTGCMQSVDTELDFELMKKRLN